MADPVVAGLIDAELARQRHGLEMIASENFASRAVIDAMGSPLTNKYAEGYPGKRYYGGCEVVDQVEQLAIDRLKQLFGADHANVQPHSGAQANFAAFMAFIRPGELLMGMSLPHGGHLSHGSAVNHSGVIWRAVHYGVNPATGLHRLRCACASRRARAAQDDHRRRQRVFPNRRFRRLSLHRGRSRRGVDGGHGAFRRTRRRGVYPSPVPHAQVVTSTTHKTLRGPRGGLILCRPTSPRRSTGRCSRVRRAGRSST